MVQSAPNETTVHAKVTGMAADPERDGWVLLDVAVEASATVEGVAAGPGGRRGRAARGPPLRRRGLGRGDRLVARVQMAGPGTTSCAGSSPPSPPSPRMRPTPTRPRRPGKRPTRKRPRSTRESPLSDDR